ncbi:MAG: 2-dehydropantoate 2-reductase [Candidatus Eremiobacteraeota bacterium]|nr:2-dehydropantoate 2-reductase [Candidatus Eremiobacteraeota bacterium]MBV9408443.1 2-dehydropantoate 2-reductase [Candidatus Eremiobacteraeota bacterium]
MRYAIVGAGAIGAYVGASLVRAGAEVVLIARGAHLTAMRRSGLRVLDAGAEYAVAPACTDVCKDVGEVDVVIVALKAHQIAPMLGEIAHLRRPDTVVVSMQNGIPWWYFQQHGGPLDGHALTAVDPAGRLARAFDPERVVGCVVYSSAELVAPGVVRHIEGTRYTLGRPGGGTTKRLEKIAADFRAGGLKAPVEENVRADVWTKLLGNVCFNPLSALTRSTLGELAADEELAPTVRAMMHETLAVAGALGITVDVSIERRIDGARRVGDHKTSTLQDVEAGRPLEVDCIIGAVVELGDLLGIDVSTTRHVYGLTKRLDRATQREAAALAGAI